MPRPANADERAASGSARRGAPGRLFRTDHHSGRQRWQQADPAGRRPGCQDHDAAQRRGLDNGTGGAVESLDRSGSRLAPDCGRCAPAAGQHAQEIGSLGVSAGSAPAAALCRNAAWVRNPIDRFVLARLEKEGIDPRRKPTIRRWPGAPQPRPDRPAADARGSRKRSSPTTSRTPTKRWSTGCWPRPITASAGRRTGSTWPATPTATATRRTARARTPGATAIGSSTRSTTTCPSTSSRSSRSPATCCPTRRSSRASPPASTATASKNREGGIKLEQFRFEETIDRTNTIGTVWLGLTVGCAQCHDHKYDPISQNEYYQLFAFFEQRRRGRHRCAAAGRDRGPTWRALPEYRARARQDLLAQYRRPRVGDGMGKPDDPGGGQSRRMDRLGPRLRRVSTRPSTAATARSASRGTSARRRTGACSPTTSSVTTTASSPKSAGRIGLGESCASKLERRCSEGFPDISRAMAVEESASIARHVTFMCAAAGTPRHRGASRGCPLSCRQLDRWTSRRGCAWPSGSCRRTTRSRRASRSTASGRSFSAQVSCPLPSDFGTRSADPFPSRAARLACERVRRPRLEPEAHAQA